jgi:hypothetical protein
MALCCRALKPGKMKGSSEALDLAQNGLARENRSCKDLCDPDREPLC